MQIVLISLLKTGESYYNTMKSTRMEVHLPLVLVLVLSFLASV